ncbi:hypothetical protein OG742_42040 [Streptomyces sp. NBC_00828]|uniref:hypothetical protein n=1 Tax=Streptomyces sp. NBC_00828 TaxID=2903678 RepID=UPI003868347A
MDVVWTMTSLESGRFVPTERRSEVSELVADFNELRSSGQGYLEIRLPVGEFPQLTLGFRDDHAVVHLIGDGGDMSLLVGDGAISSDTVVDVPIMDDLAEFTGDFILSVDHAWGVVGQFIERGAVEDLGEWYEL